MTEDTLFASVYANYWGTRARVPIADIRQIYTLAHKMPRIPRDSQMYRGIVRKNPEARSYLLQQFTSFSLFALTHDGKRVPLMSQIPNEASALYVEETLEVALGLFNLPVYGDQSLPRDLQTQVNLASTHSPELKVLNCKCCGAPLPATPNSARIGYLVCEHCHVLSLLYGAGTSKPILGLPQLNSPTSQFEITKVEKRLRIRSRETRDGTFLLLSKTDLEFRVSLSRSIETLNSAEIADIFAKEVDLMGPSFGIDLSNQSDWTEELAHSGDLEKSYQRIHGTLFYQLIAKTTAGKQICFLDKIKNPHEALALAERITYLYQPNTIVKG